MGLKKYLMQKEWFRQFFNETTYYLSSGVWKELSEFNIGEKIEELDGDWNHQLWCECGNELVHSKSFIGERGDFYKDAVLDYKCTHCNKEHHFNPMPGVFVSCDKNGRIS